MGYQFFLPMVLRWRASRAEAPLKQHFTSNIHWMWFSFSSALTETRILSLKQFTVILYQPQHGLSSKLLRKNSSFEKKQPWECFTWYLKKITAKWWKCRDHPTANFESVQVKSNGADNFKWMQVDASKIKLISSPLLCTHWQMYMNLSLLFNVGQAWFCEWFYQLYVYR